MTIAGDQLRLQLDVEVHSCTPAIVAGRDVLYVTYRVAGAERWTRTMLVPGATMTLERLQREAVEHARRHALRVRRVAGKTRNGRRPPKRRCAVCGGDCYSWVEPAVCRKCRDELAPDRHALVGEVKRRRQVRKPAPAARELTVPYNVFPEGF